MAHLLAFVRETLLTSPVWQWSSQAVSSGLAPVEAWLATLPPLPPSLRAVFDPLQPVLGRFARAPGLYLIVLSLGVLLIVLLLIARVSSYCCGGKCGGRRRSSRQRRLGRASAHAALSTPPPAAPLDPHARARLPVLRVGIDIGGTKCQTVALDRDGSVIHTSRTPTGIGFTIEQLEAELAQFFEAIQAEIVPGICLGDVTVGCSIPGLADEATGELLFISDVPGIEGWVPGSSPSLSQCKSVVVLNDIKAAMVEAREQLPDARNMVVLVVGTGLGTAQLVNGVVMRGSSGHAGELGLSPMGDGMSFDDLCGGKSLLKRLRMTPEEVSAALARGDVDVQDAIDRAGRHFGWAISHSINVFNPECIIIAGGTVRWPGYLESAIEEAEKRAIAPMWKRTVLVHARHSRMLPVLGAAKAPLQAPKPPPKRSLDEATPEELEALLAQMRRQSAASESRSRSRSRSKAASGAKSPGRPQPKLSGRVLKPPNTAR